MVLPPLAPVSHGARFGDCSVPVLPGSAHRGSLHGRRGAGREAGGAASSCPPLPVPVPRPPSAHTHSCSVCAGGLFSFPRDGPGWAPGRGRVLRRRGPWGCHLPCGCSSAGADGSGCLFALWPPPPPPGRTSGKSLQPCRLLPVPRLSLHGLPGLCPSPSGIEGSPCVPRLAL